MAVPWAGIVAAGSALATNIWNASEARKNRQFQERMSSTAHQREVADLRAANVNPAWRGLGGASSPGGDRAEMEDVGSKGVSSALAAAQMKAGIKLTEAQTRLASTQANDISSTLGNRTGLMQAQTGLANMSTQQMTEMLPVLLKKAQEEIGLTANSARAAEANALLSEAAAARAGNLEAFEKRIGEAGPWVRFFFELLRGIRQ